MKTRNQVLKGSFVGYLNGKPIVIKRITDLGYIVSGFLMRPLMADDCQLTDMENVREQEFVFMRESLFRQHIDQLTPVGMEVIDGGVGAYALSLHILNKLHRYSRSRNLAAVKILYREDLLSIMVTISYFFRKEKQ